MFTFNSRHFPWLFKIFFPRICVTVTHKNEHPELLIKQNINYILLLKNDGEKKERKKKNFTE